MASGRAARHRAAGFLESHDMRSPNTKSVVPAPMANMRIRRMKNLAALLPPCTIPRNTAPRHARISSDKGGISPIDGAIAPSGRVIQESCSAFLPRRATSCRFDRTMPCGSRDETMLDRILLRQPYSPNLRTSGYYRGVRGLWSATI
jgi:hypothetical protein